jgi:hypothetical protein
LSMSSIRCRSISLIRSPGALMHQVSTGPGKP